MRNHPSAESLELAGLISRSAAATRFGISTDTIRRASKNGVETHRDSSGRVYVRPEDLERLGYAVRTVPAGAEATSALALEQARVTITKHQATISSLEIKNAELAGRLTFVTILVDGLREQVQDFKKQMEVKDRQIARLSDLLAQSTQSTQSAQSAQSAQTHRSAA